MNYLSLHRLQQALGFSLRLVIGIKKFQLLPYIHKNDVLNSASYQNQDECNVCKWLLISLTLKHLVKARLTVKASVTVVFINLKLCNVL